VHVDSGLYMLLSDINKDGGGHAYSVSIKEKECALNKYCGCRFTYGEYLSTFWIFAVAPVDYITVHDVMLNHVYVLLGVDILLRYAHGTS